MPHRRIVKRWRRLAPDAGIVLVVLLLVSLVCRTVFLSAESLIYDEYAYVSAARVILGRPANVYGGQPSGLDPNREHPPLGKLLIAGSIRILGDDPLGWRFPSVVAGMASIALLYAIARALGGDRWLAVLAAALFAFDNLVLVHSRIAMLDMPLVAFLLLGAWLSLRGRPLLGGAACALAALVKLVGVYGLLALLVYEAAQALWAWRRTGVWPPDAWPAAAKIAVSFGVVWFLGLWLLDLRFSVYHTPWDHLRFMLHYGFSYANPAVAGVRSEPWQWLVNRVQIPYLRVDKEAAASAHAVYTRAAFFRGAMNPAIIWAAPLAIGYAAWRFWRSGDKLALWTLVWFGATYLPFYPLATIGHRISFIYYFLPALPAVAVGLALLLRRSGLPRVIVWGYLLAVLAGFISYFPFHNIF